LCSQDFWAFECANITKDVKGLDSILGGLLMCTQCNCTGEKEIQNT